VKWTLLIAKHSLPHTQCSCAKLRSRRTVAPALRTRLHRSRPVQHAHCLHAVPFTFAALRLADETPFPATGRRVSVSPDWRAHQAYGAGLPRREPGLAGVVDGRAS
jgi:hypothetical protein